MHYRRFSFGLALVVVALGSSPSMAGLLDFEFFMTAGSGSTLDLGSGAIDVSGTSYTLTGSTINDVDLRPADDDEGMFAAVMTFDFGIIGTFSTSSILSDAYYIQNCETDTAISCAGVVDLGIDFGFVAELPSVVAVSDVDVGQPLGSNIVPADVDFSNSLTFGNTLGQSLELTFSDTSVSEFSVTASSVPAPATLTLIGLGLLGLRLRRRV